MAVLAEYFVGRDEGYLFLADARGDEPSITPFAVKPLYSEAADYLQRVLGESDVEVGQSLRAIVQPIVERAAEDELIWIVPHGILHYLPFHAIPTSEGILGFRNPVCYGPSASALPLCRRGPRLRGNAVITLGDPTGDLAFARREAEGVAEAFKGGRLMGGKATKHGLFSALDAHEAVDVVHFACHGRAGAEDPFQAGVLLAPDRGDPQRRPDLLSAGELLRWKLHAALVTVSACDAGLARVESSDEVLGLTRALLYAGVSSVLLSYWPLDDLSTYLTMMRFYEELRRMMKEGGGSKAVALQAAQRHIHDLTLRDVIASCDAGAAQCAMRQDLPGQLDFLEEAVDWATTAGDFDEALRRTRNIRTLLANASTMLADRRQRIQDRAEELEFRSMLRRTRVNYDARPFDDEMHWAGFFLHGDWNF